MGKIEISKKKKKKTGPGLCSCFEIVLPGLVSYESHHSILELLKLRFELLIMEEGIHYKFR